jgi:hypothetical protein
MDETVSGGAFSGRVDYRLGRLAASDVAGAGL